MIRLLLDQCVPAGATARLRVAGWDAVHATELGLERARDVELLEVAARDGRVIVTFDYDFSQLLALSGKTRPAVVHFRREFDSNEKFAAALISVLEVARIELSVGCVVSVDETAVRIRRLPFGPGAG